VDDGNDAPSISAGAAAAIDDDTPGVERLLALSDGVVAIALTLLVLQLVVPTLDGVSNSDAESWHYLWHQLSKSGGDQFIAYVVSFFVIAQFWLTHHRVFKSIQGHVEGLAWWNFAFLFTITLMPFTSELVGRFGHNPLAIDIFAFNLLLANFATQGVRIFARTHGLQSPSVNPREVREGSFRALWAVAVTLMAAITAWFDPGLATVFWLLLVPSHFVARTAAARFPARSPA
jgi:uncharacterized membrane protein